MGLIKMTLTGPTGCGKTTLLEDLARLGYAVGDEEEFWAGEGTVTVMVTSPVASPVRALDREHARVLLRAGWKRMRRRLPYAKQATWVYVCTAGGRGKIKL